MGLDSLKLTSQKFLVINLSTSPGLKAESNLEPLSGSEHGTLGLGSNSYQNNQRTIKERTIGTSIKRIICKKFLRKNNSNSAVLIEYILMDLEHINKT